MTALVLRGDARRLPLPDASVDLIVTSPPYFALRSYTDDGEHYDGQIGSEPTPAEYLDALWACTAEWMRVLKPEGSLWVNLGDKYSTGNSGQSGLAALGERWAGGGHSDAKAKQRSAPAAGFPPKTLLGIPWRYALGCIDQLGLILRRDQIWHKLNPLPESTNDRTRSQHEYLFHFVKQPRYYTAVDEIREAHTGKRDPATYRATGVNGAEPSAHKAYRNPDRGYFTTETEHGRDYNPLGKLPGSVWSIPSEPFNPPKWEGNDAGRRVYFWGKTHDLALPKAERWRSAAPGRVLYRMPDHFAAFPTELPRKVILGWSPPGICTACGQGRRPVVDKSLVNVWHDKPPVGTRYADNEAAHLNNRKHVDDVMMRRFGSTQATITGYACDCDPLWSGAPCFMCNGTGIDRIGGRCRACNGHGKEPSETLPSTRPAVVLDPFGGTGTTALVAHALGRVGITVDMSADYSRLARWRTTDRGELAKAMRVPKPAPVPDGQLDMFSEVTA